MINKKILLKKFAEDVGFTKFQIDSFNDFLDRRLQKVIDEIGEIKPEVPEIGDLRVRFGKVSIGEPSVREADGTVRKILPMEARARDLTYAAPIYVDMTPIINGSEQGTYSVKIGEIPIMLKSKYCDLSKMTKEELEEIGEDPNDPGGYFIINGTERALILMEEIAENRMILQKQEVGNYPYTLRINSERNGYIQRHLLERKTDGTVYISFANIRRLPIIIILKALGMESDKDIIEKLKEDEVINEFLGNIYESEVATKDQAYEAIAAHLKIPPKEFKKQRINQIIDKYLLPHLGQESKDREKKAKYLIEAIRKIIKFSLGILKEDDIDHYANKRVRMSGDLLELLIRSILIGKWGLIARIKYNYQKMAKRGKLPPIQTIVEANVMTNQINSAMATGSWVGGRTGVSQRLERSAYTKTLSHLRLVLSPLTSTQEHFEARELHATHWGRFCPAETPEGPTIGLRKHLAYFAQITKGISKNEKNRLVRSLKLKEDGEITVYVDGIPEGYVDSFDIVEEIRKKRRSGEISHEINVGMYKETKEIYINTSKGRVVRPLIIIENGKSKLTEEHVQKLEKNEWTWDDLTKNGIIEWLDAEEEENALVALSEEDLEKSKDWTHMELSMLGILGTSAGLIVFPQFNRGDRVILGAKMLGQAIGIFQTSYLVRTDTKSNILVYPQVPLVKTDITDPVGLEHNPSGQNIVIALMSYKGFNIEDALIFNKASLDRGLFRSIFYRTYPAEQKRYWGGQEDLICIPEKDVRGYRTEEDYRKLGEDGIILPETEVNGSDVLVGRISPLRFLSATELMGGIANTRESSICMRPSEKGVVDNVFITETSNGTKLVKVKVRDLRIPELGDKFASRHGQKGVIGLIVDEKDMPFTANGITPDIIFNPHSIPSRQTIGQLLEILSGKLTAMSTEDIEASAFSKISEEELREKLRKMGFRSDGKETMYNGITGEKYEVEIFVGINYYQKLDHMVANKIQARARGPVTLLTRQPTEGKAKEGGLRLGEMEKDCLIAHGAVLTLKERFDSDKTIVPICRKCGIVATWNKSREEYVCPICKGTDIKEVSMSYAFKLLLDELKAMLIYPKINVEG